MNEERPFLQLPVPSQDDMKLYEEWLKRKEEAEEAEEERVVIIEL